MSRASAVVGVCLVAAALLMPAQTLAGADRDDPSSSTSRLPVEVPEPASLLLLGTGLAVIANRLAKKRTLRKKGSDASA